MTLWIGGCVGGTAAGMPNISEAGAVAFIILIILG